MRGYRVIGEERLKRKRKWNTVYVGGLMETTDYLGWIDTLENRKAIEEYCKEA